MLRYNVAGLLKAPPGEIRVYPVSNETMVVADDLPLAVALRERHPDHSSFSIVDHEGRQRDIKVTAMPLFATWSEFVGAIAMFWEDRPPDMPPSTPETP